MPKEFGVSNRNVDSQRFRPKVKEAISFEVAFLVSATPPSGRHRWRVLVKVGALRRLTAPIFGG